MDVITSELMQFLDDEQHKQWPCQNQHHINYNATARPFLEGSFAGLVKTRESMGRTTDQLDPKVLVSDEEVNYVSGNPAGRVATLKY